MRYQIFYITLHYVLCSLRITQWWVIFFSCPISHSFTALSSFSFLEDLWYSYGHGSAVNCHLGPDRAGLSKALWYILNWKFHCNTKVDALKICALCSVRFEQTSRLRNGNGFYVNRGNNCIWGTVFSLTHIYPIYQRCNLSTKMCVVDYRFKVPCAIGVFYFAPEALQNYSRQEEGLQEFTERGGEWDHDVRILPAGRNESFVQRCIAEAFYRVMTFFLLIRYITLWPWRVIFWPWTVVGNFSSRDLTVHLGLLWESWPS